MMVRFVNCIAVLFHMVLAGIAPPSPACKRALKLVVDAISAVEGNEVVEL